MNTLQGRFNNIDAAREATLTRDQVIHEICQHHTDPQDFFEEVGNKTSYTGDEVLNWLGY